MACATCNGPMIWQGSTSRGGLVCPGCGPKKQGRLIAYGVHGFVSPTMYRYFSQVDSFHRSWCEAKKNAVANKQARSKDEECTCGYTRPCKLSKAEIEKEEIKAYGELE